MRILMVEDNKELCEAVSFQLQKEGYTVDTCSDGDDGLRWIKEQAHDLIILDRMLPRMNGLDVLKKTRQNGINTPVLIVTALDGIGDRVDGLDAGADDYIVKPFAIEELLARIRAMNRRPRNWEAGNSLQFGGTELNPLKKILKGPEKESSLSKRECDLLETLFKNPAQTMPRQVLLSRVWGPDAPVEEGNLDNYVHFLRRRLKAVGSQLEIITVRGVGYRLEAPENA